MAQEGMFWELVLEDVIEILAEFNIDDFGRECTTGKTNGKKGRREDPGQSSNAVKERYSQENMH